MKGVPFDQLKIVLKKTVAQCEKNQIFSTTIEQTRGPKDEQNFRKSLTVKKRKRWDPLGFHIIQ